MNDLENNAAWIAGIITKVFKVEVEVSFKPTSIYKGDRFSIVCNELDFQYGCEDVFILKCREVILGEVSDRLIDTIAEIQEEKYKESLEKEIAVVAC